MLATWGCATFPKPTLDLQFAGATSLDSRITFTRASTATYFNSAGVLTSAAINEARFDYNPSTLAAQGLLIEEARTNSIRNNTMQGAVAGTPGTLPTNWFSTSIGGVALTQVVGTGTENGITYIDVRFAGTTSSTAAGGITTDGTTQIAALSGQTWASSFYIRLVGGSTSGITDILNTIQERDAGGVLLVATNTTISPTGSALNTQRVATTRTLNNASTAFVNQQLRITPQSGVAIDITLRIGLPQMELGAFATSVIPTTTTALTRNADVASMTGTNFSSWYNASEGTIVTQFTNRNPLIDAVPVTANDNTNNNRIGFDVTSTGFGRLVVDTLGASQVLAGTAGLVAGGNAKMAGAYKVNDFAISKDGGAVSTDTSGTVPTVTQLQIGSRISALFLNSYIQRIAYYPSRLPNTTLQALTA